MKTAIPNTITSLNIVSGCLSLVLAFEGNLILASYFIGLAAIFDFFDGMTARLLHAYTRIGKELDSLADIVSFGIAPSVIIYQLLKLTLRTEGLLFNIEYPRYFEIIVLMSSFIIAVFSALRLAKFNLDSRQSESFIGLPVPANALFIAALPLILFNAEFTFFKDIILNIYFLLLVVFVGSYLLVAEIPMFSLKFKNLDPRHNVIRFVFIGFAVLLILIFKYVALPLIIIFYILLSVFNNLFIKKKN
ncbi:MAG: CDP-diacylglycerol O-phosphatidyltransferase [Chlorobi bacterium]|nr:CDP-diacylglycerol O-phosphatidyltransferase [Chlorobiota bacterium]